MTPLGINLLLHYWAHTDEHPGIIENRLTVRSALNGFLHEDLLEPIPEDQRRPNDFRTYRVTARGEALVKALTSLPLPVCKWVMPEDQNDAND